MDKQPIGGRADDRQTEGKKKTTDGQSDGGTCRQTDRQIDTVGHIYE